MARAHTLAHTHGGRSAARCSRAHTSRAAPSTSPFKLDQLSGIKIWSNTCWCNTYLDYTYLVQTHHTGYSHTHPARRSREGGDARQGGDCSLTFCLSLSPAHTLMAGAWLFCSAPVISHSRSLAHGLSLSRTRCIRQERGGARSALGLAPLPHN